jgi:predicted nucleic acid-binding protein
VLVVDANIVVYLLIEGEKTAQARALWATDHDWRAPQLLFYELANVFSQLLKRRDLSLEAASSGLDSGLGLVRLLDAGPPAARILEIASRLGLSAYDASYLATAELLRTPLVTEDARLLRAAPEITRSLMLVTTQPAAPPSRPQ